MDYYELQEKTEEYRNGLFLNAFWVSTEAADESDYRTRLEAKENIERTQYLLLDYFCENLDENYEEIMQSVDDDYKDAIEEMYQNYKKDYLIEIDGRLTVDVDDLPDFLNMKNALNILLLEVRV